MNVNNGPVWVEAKCKGEITGVDFFGRFSVRRYLTHKERGEAVRYGEVLCRGIEDVALRAFYMTMAFVDAHVIESDAVWYAERGMDLVDEQPIWSISSEIRKLQKPAEAKKDEAPVVAAEVAKEAK